MSRQQDVFVGVASIPSREASLKKVVQRLLPQARHVGVYLNGYDSVPRFLRRSRITVARSQDHGDIRDNGKFFFLRQSDARFYAAADDDILYPSDYLAHMVATSEGAGQRAAVGVHGALYPSPVVDLFEPRYLLHFKDPLPQAMPVHLLGTGTVLFNQTEWKLDPGEFGTPGMADVWFGAAAARREASLFAVPRIANWLSPIVESGDASSGGALFFEGLLHRAEQVAALNQACPPERTFEGLVRPLLSSPEFSEEFSLHQALSLDDIRSQLGYSPLTAEQADRLGVILEGQRSVWAHDHLITLDEVRSVDRLMVDILANRASSESVTPVIDLLDYLEDLATTDFRKWASLPESLRYDSSPERLVTLRTALLERGMERSSGDAAKLWNEHQDRVDMTVTLALHAETASTQTGLERLPAFKALAEENPISAAARLYDYFEANDWSREPDVLALQNAFASEFDSLDVQMLMCVSAARSGNSGLAERILSRLRQRWPWDVDLRLLEASLSVPDSATPLEAISPIFEVLDETLTPFGLGRYRDLMTPSETAAHWIELLGGDATAAQPESDSNPTVSVLMTTHNDAATIVPALRSVLASTGVVLQVVVVDDASTDDTAALAASLHDRRVEVVRNETNLGPYLSRNRGLERASGDYVAIADADDWTHPQRLEFQASILAESPHLFACKVAHVRMRPNGVIDLENHLRFVGDGPVTMMFRRWLVDHIGGFDHVRTRGDIEYLRRIAARFGPEALASLGIPLVLATSSPSSNSKRFYERHLNQYRAAARLWHELRAGTDNLYVPLAGRRAPFMAPYELLAVRSEGSVQPVEENSQSGLGQVAQTSRST